MARRGYKTLKKREKPWRNYSSLYLSEVKEVEVPQVQYAVKPVQNIVGIPKGQIQQVVKEVEALRLQKIARPVPVEKVVQVPQQQVVYKDVPMEALKYREMPRAVHNPVQQVRQVPREMVFPRSIPVPCERIVQVDQPVDNHVPFQREVPIAAPQIIHSDTPLPAPVRQHPVAGAVPVQPEVIPPTATSYAVATAAWVQEREGPQSQPEDGREEVQVPQKVARPHTDSNNAPVKVIQNRHLEETGAVRVPVQQGEGDQVSGLQDFRNPLMELPSLSLKGTLASGKKGVTVFRGIFNGETVAAKRAEVGGDEEKARHQLQEAKTWRGLTEKMKGSTQISQFAKGLSDSSFVSAIGLDPCFLPFLSDAFRLRWTERVQTWSNAGLNLLPLLSPALDGTETSSETPHVPIQREIPVAPPQISHGDTSVRPASVEPEEKRREVPKCL
uniref:Uncharacterized protein n=1 Tax=Chromera velia CCMP2878 TaxID=1169474 RepID=A0A0G4FSA8_9ALVE|eukprot:Cvel_3694.t1-p1 / transcript=Cvel_3694.t1 / gene=Cvel_3694 / organism=Chromera_velia_CCMP2878 / gene_product=hypothetical protein / transcript_product=hypothetical protein / location=Cvel_scaffold153:102004-107396(-) / protein_length=442 / sequence_SO=supercontig / SO=protein_coding / is_pseudo=false